MGRFTTQDPIGLPGGENLYRYAPNALGWVDPWGLCAFKSTSNSQMVVFLRLSMPLSFLEEVRLEFPSMSWSDDVEFQYRSEVF